MRDKQVTFKSFFYLVAFLLCYGSFPLSSVEASGSLVATLLNEENESIKTQPKTEGLLQQTTKAVSGTVKDVEKTVDTITSQDAPSSPQTRAVSNSEESIKTASESKDVSTEQVKDHETQPKTEGLLQQTTKAVSGTVLLSRTVGNVTNELTTGVSSLLNTTKEAKGQLSVLESPLTPNTIKKPIRELGQLADNSLRSVDRIAVNAVDQIGATTGNLANTTNQTVGNVLNNGRQGVNDVTGILPIRGLGELVDDSLNSVDRIVANAVDQIGATTGNLANTTNQTVGNVLNNGRQGVNDVTGILPIRGLGELVDDSLNSVDQIVVNAGEQVVGVDILPNEDGNDTRYRLGDTINDVKGGFKNKKNTYKQMAKEEFLSLTHGRVNLFQSLASNPSTSLGKNPHAPSSFAVHENSKKTNSPLQQGYPTTQIVVQSPQVPSGQNSSSTSSSSTSGSAYYSFYGTYEGGKYALNHSLIGKIYDRERLLATQFVADPLGKPPKTPFSYS